jgi:hypothetical protein
MNQLQGTYEYIDLDYVLAGVKMQLGLRDTTSEDIYLRDCLNIILKDLRSFGTTTYIVTQLEIDHEGATPKCKLPDGFIRFVKHGSIVFVNAEGQAVPAVNENVQVGVTVNGEGQELGSTTYVFPYQGLVQTQPAFINNAFFENSPYDQSRMDAVTMNVVDGYMYFSDNLQADFVKIAYLGTLYENGQIKIPAYAELALTYGACEKWSATQFAITGDQKFRIMQNDYQVKYARHKAKAKVIPLMPDAKEYSLINAQFTTLI